MRTTDEKCLHFVLRHYQKNKLDTQKALKAFKEKYQITEQTRNHPSACGGYFPVWRQPFWS